jgi:hypothetical protein
VFLRRADAEAALEAVLRDEPESRELMSVVEIELDERDVSPTNFPSPVGSTAPKRPRA